MALVSSRYTYCLSRGNIFDDKQLRVEYEQKRATRSAIIHSTRGDTERTRGTFIIPLSTVRSARRIMREGHGGRPRLPPCVAPMRRHTASKDTSVAAHGRRKAPIASKSVRYDIRPSILFSPPSHGLVAMRYSSEAIDMTIS